MTGSGRSVYWSETAHAARRCVAMVGSFCVKIQVAICLCCFLRVYQRKQFSCDAELCLTRPGWLEYRSAVCRNGYSMYCIQLPHLRHFALMIPFVVPGFTPRSLSVDSLPWTPVTTGLQRLPCDPLIARVGSEVMNPRHRSSLWGRR